MKKLYLTSMFVVVAQLVCTWVFGSQLWHFHEHPWYLQAINAAGLPLALYTAYRSGVLAWRVRQDEKEHLARMRSLHARVEALHELRRKMQEEKK